MGMEAKKKRAEGLETYLWSSVKLLLHWGRKHYGYVRPDMFLEKSILLSLWSHKNQNNTVLTIFLNSKAMSTCKSQRFMKEVENFFYTCISSTMLWQTNINSRTNSVTTVLSILYSNWSTAVSLFPGQICTPGRNEMLKAFFDASILSCHIKAHRTHRPT